MGGSVFLFSHLVAKQPLSFLLWRQVRIIFFQKEVPRLAVKKKENVGKVGCLVENKSKKPSSHDYTRDIDSFSYRSHFCLPFV